MKFSVFLVFFLAVCTFSEADDPVHAEYDVIIKGAYGYNSTHVTVDLDKENQVVTATVERSPMNQFGAGFSYFDVRNNFGLIRHEDGVVCRVNVPTTAPVTIESAESLLVAPVFKEYDGYDAERARKISDQTDQAGVLPIVHCSATVLSDGTSYSQEVQDAMAKYCAGTTVVHDLKNCNRTGSSAYRGWYCVSGGVMATPQGLQLACLTLAQNSGK